jgi:hypothetical protein
VASRSKWHRLEALLRNRAFIADYIRARDAWRDGHPVAFPPGTYWLRVSAHVELHQHAHVELQRSQRGRASKREIVVAGTAGPERDDRGASVAV